ncbi:MAG: hypothetical protein AAF449_01190 [Myxococcota bacterium]
MDDKYGERVTEIIDIAKSYGADTVMLGMPIMRSPKFSKKMRRLNRVMKKATEEAGMLFVPTYKKASTSDGKYRTTVEHRGRRGLMRTSDGVHYTRLGAQFVIEQAMIEIERRYRFEPKDNDLGIAMRHGFKSPSVGEHVWYTAYVPKKRDPKRPAIVLLPDAKDWDGWPRYPHRELQKMAESAQAVIVVPEKAHQTAYVGPLASVLRDELPRDLLAHLPVSSVFFAGSGRGALSALAVGGKSAGVFLHRPWPDPSTHTDDPALVKALGKPAANTGKWGSNGWARSKGPPVWIQVSKLGALKSTLSGRVKTVKPPDKTFLAAMGTILPTLAPKPVAPTDSQKSR